MNTAKRRWTEAEDDSIRSQYASTEDVDSVVPNRTRTSITRRAHELGVKRPRNRPHPGKVVAPIIVRDGVEGKACTKCLEWMSLDRFARAKTHARGRRNICTTCEGRQAYANNPEGCRAATRRWQNENPGKVREAKQVSNRRRHGRKVAGSGVPVAYYRELKSLYGGLCAYCGIRPADTMDHVVPLSRGGEHSIDNVLPACEKCNFEKHDKTLEEWVAHRQGR